MTNPAALRLARQSQLKLLPALLGWSLVAAVCFVGSAAAFGFRVATYLQWIGW